MDLWSRLDLNWVVREQNRILLGSKEKPHFRVNEPRGEYMIKDKDPTPPPIIKNTTQDKKKEATFGAFVE